MNKEYLKKPGDVVIDEVIIRTRSGNNIDIYNSFLSMDIYESIYNPYLEGFITMTDTKNIKSIFPLVGDETLEVSFRTPGKTNIRRTFSVRGMGPTVPTSNKNEVIHQLKFSSKSYIVDMTTKISRSFKNIERSKIVESIYDQNLRLEDSQNMLELKTIPSTNGPTSLVIPFWSPFKAITKIANHCEYMGNCDYMFFETIDSVYFYPISFLKTRPSTNTYFYPETGTRPSGNSVDITLELRKIIDYVLVEQMNEKYDNLFKGMYSGTNLCFDTTYKKPSLNPYAYARDFLETDHVEDNPILPKIRDDYSTKYLSSIYKTDTASYLFDGLASHNTIKNNMFKRNNHILHLSSQKMTINLYGDTDMRCGQVIEVLIPSKQPLSSSSQDKDDKQASGRYLIASLGHHLTRENHMMTLDICRDSLPEPIPDFSEFS